MDAYEMARERSARFPVVRRPLDERVAARLLPLLRRWMAGGAMYEDVETSLSRHTGGRI